MTVTHTTDCGICGAECEALIGHGSFCSSCDAYWLTNNTPVQPKKGLSEQLRGRGRIEATLGLEAVNAFIKSAHGKPRPLSFTEGNRIHHEANLWMRKIRRAWPVRTGTSRAGWTFFINPSPGKVAVIFENPVYYSGWLSKKGEVPVSLGGRPYYQTLLQEICLPELPELVEILKAEILKTEKKYERLLETGLPYWEALEQAGLPERL